MRRTVVCKHFREDSKKPEHPCEHTTVLEIYANDSHTKVAHYRCPSCGETRPTRFGKNIVRDKIFISTPQIKVPEGYARDGDFGFVYDKNGKKWRAIVRLELKED